MMGPAWSPRKAGKGIPTLRLCVRQSRLGGWKAGSNGLKGDVRDTATCNEAVTGVDVLLHQAALGSVPRSIADPLVRQDTNANG